MSDKKDDTLMEETNLIQVNDGHIGTFNKVVYLVITLICLLYLVLFFRP
ncbi:MAG: hypothetical protein K9N55_02570 [Phycisphaerae bacterium]|nr:hypothetical protein [Phycisphaerae bacterium]